MAVFASRQIAMPVLSIAVTITGSGDSSKCYAIINGTKQYSAGTHEVYAGDTITFGVGGGRSSPGWVEIDGTEVLRVTGKMTETYDWTVPSSISTVEISMEYTSVRGGRITVTTDNNSNNTNHAGGAI